jgi:predicted nucleic acid-binding protein
MLYFDASFVAPLIRQEPTSAALLPFFGELPAGELAMSRWTRLELSSVLARDVRMARIDGEGARAAETDLDLLIGETFVIVVPNAGDFDLAQTYVGRYETGLRAGDALHLAIARNHGAEAIYTLDKTLLKAGRILGLPVGTGVELPGYEP